MFLLRAFTVWLVLIGAEVGDFRARQLGVFTGSLLILGLTYLFIEWIRAGTTARLLAVGLLWLVLTVLFEFSFGRLVLGLPWERITEDYDLSRGGLMPLGLLVLTLSPLLVARWLWRGQSATAVELGPSGRSRSEESGPRGDEPVRSDRQ